MKAIFHFLLVFVSLHSINAQIGTYPTSNPVELGKVTWLRDYDQAIVKSKAQKLPILILFQEVPGCSNCTAFGNDILSHPLFVEAAETCFVPLCIYNNNNGKDAEILKKYGEPSWNNPVVRIVNVEGKDIVPRQGDFRSRGKTLKSMTDALQKSNIDVPVYLDLLSQEWSAETEEAYLSMYCFWTGEKEIAGIDGVIGTEAGYMHGHEVVKVVFDKSRTNLDDIASKAQKAKCADQVYGGVTQGKVDKVVGTYHKDREDKYYLYKSKYKVIPMTQRQKAMVNRTLALGQDPTKYLSPRQLAILSMPVNRLKDQRGEDIASVWYK